MASMRDIKRRRDSIQSTEQITKAMKLVATVKLQKSKAKAENSKPYFNLMYETISSVLCKSGNLNHKYLKAGDSPKKAVIVLTSNRGLAGGYNSNIIRLVNSSLPAADTYVYALGRKGRDGLARRGFQIKADYSEVMNEPMYRDAADLTVELLDAFAQGQVGEIYLAYTSFKNTVSQTPKLMKYSGRYMPAEAIRWHGVSTVWTGKVMKPVHLSGSCCSPVRSGTVRSSASMGKEKIPEKW